jgi:hypothetical protein
MLKKKPLKVSLTWILFMGMLLLMACSHVLVATDRNTHTEFLREGAGCTHYLGSEVSITVPGPGKIAVDGLAWIGLWSHTTGNNEEVRIYLGSSPTECTFGNEAEGYNAMSFSIPKGMPTWKPEANAGWMWVTIPVSRTFTVTEAGTKTFYLNGEKMSGTPGGNMAFYYATMKAVYYPDK